MSPRRQCLPLSSALPHVALLTLVTAVGSAAPRTAVSSRLLNDYDGAAVDRAKAGAALRLQDPECLKVLTDFSDERGRRLDQNLEPWGMSAADYVRSIPFVPGAAAPSCGNNRVSLATVPGVFPVFVCPAGVGHLRSLFASVQVREPALAEIMVIHEMLHTLGLGENPPSTFEITEQVKERCR